MFGYKTEAPATVASSGGLDGHNVIPGGSSTEIFQPVYYMKAGGVHGGATISPPETITSTPVIEMLPHNLLKFLLKTHQLLFHQFNRFNRLRLVQLRFPAHIILPNFTQPPVKHQSPPLLPRYRSQ